MGKTVRRTPSYDDESQNGRRGKHRGHSNNKRTGGMRIVNSVYEDEDDYLDDEVYIEDEIVINKRSE